MFCIKCGSEIADESSFCMNCGASQKERTRIGIKLSKKFWCAVVILLIGVITVVFLQFGGGINESPEQVAVAAVEAMYEVDPDKLVQTFPDFVVRENAQAYGLVEESATREEIAKAMKEFIALSSPVRQDAEIISCKITGDLDSQDISWSYYGITRSEFLAITDTAVVMIECLVDNENLYREIYCIEMDDKWYVLDMD